MRVLLAHNYYGTSSPSGENRVFELEKGLLESRGHDVAAFVRHSDTLRERGWLGALYGAIATPWNPRTTRAVRNMLRQFQPDVVHVHNTFPLISPAIFSAIGTAAARVLTLHNYRLFCPGAVPIRCGKPCTLCLDEQSVIPAIRHRCYRNSRLATVPLALSVAFHRWLGTWSDEVDAFIVFTHFQRRAMIAAGLPPDRVWVKPNFYPGSPAVRPWSERREAAVFVGRLTEEKGVRLLIDAWGSWGNDAPELRIVGDGPLRSELEQRAKATGARRTTFVGQVPSADAEREIAGAKLLVVPSIGFEGFPLVVREAFAFGTPVAASAIGPLPDLVEPGPAGVLFRANDPVSLLDVVRSVWLAESRLQTMSEGARQAYEEHYAEDSNYRQLIGIYSGAMAANREKVARC